MGKIYKTTKGFYSQITVSQEALDDCGVNYFKKILKEQCKEFLKKENAVLVGKIRISRPFEWFPYRFEARGRAKFEDKIILEKRRNSND